jgi:hypothetical protein
MIPIFSLRVKSPHAGRNRSYFGAGPRGVPPPPGPLISRFSRANVGGPEALRKARTQPHFDLTLPRACPSAFFAVFEVSQKRENLLDKRVYVL